MSKAKVVNSTSFIGKEVECEDCGEILKIKQNGATCAKCNAHYTLTYCVKMKVNNRHNIQFKKDRREWLPLEDE